MCQTSATASLSPAAARSSLWTVSLNLLAFHATVASAGNVSALHSSRSTGDVEIIDIDADKRGSQRRSLRRAAKRVSSGEVHHREGPSTWEMQPLLYIHRGRCGKSLMEKQPHVNCKRANKIYHAPTESGIYRSLMEKVGKLSSAVPYLRRCRS